MFTGIISDIGEVVAVAKPRDARFVIASHYEAETIALGASIACHGCCLTVVELERLPDGRTGFTVDVSVETLSKTTLGQWQVGSKINLERALKMGDELGGHVVSGHVDGVGQILQIAQEAESQRFKFAAPPELARFIAPKGSVTLNGTSLTVNEVEGNTFGVNLIPHSLAVTTWGHARVGDEVNIEIDMLARYVARLAEFGTS